MNTQPNNPEEVDLIQFFKAFGNMFKSLFVGVKKLFEAIFYQVVNLIIYVKKYYLYFGIAVLIALILAFLNNKNAKKLYTAKVTVQANYDAQIALKNKLDYFNNLIEGGQFDLLGKELGIPNENAKNIVGFDIDPQFSDVYLAENYDDYLSKMDTTMHNNIPFADYKKSVSDNEDLYNYWTIEVLATHPTDFFKLNDSFANILDDNKLLTERKNNYLFALNTTKNNVLRSLKDIDSMRNVYNTVLLENAKKPASSGTSVVVTGDNIAGPEAAYDLFGKRDDLLKKLQFTASKINRFNHILQLKNSFPAYGEEKSSVTDNLYVRYPLLAMLLVFLILFAIDFNKFLNKYQKEKEAQS